MKLKEIRYKNHDDFMEELCGIQLVFTNGTESPMFETSCAKSLKFKTISIDTEKTIR